MGSGCGPRPGRGRGALRPGRPLRHLPTRERPRPRQRPGGAGMTTFALPVVESPLRADDAVLDVTVAPGDGFLGRVPAGGSFRIVDLAGNQAADTLFYDAADVTNR